MKYCGMNASRIQIPQIDGHVGTHDLGNGYFVSVHNRIEQVRRWWAQVVSDNDVFLRADYLSVLEAAPPQGMECWYLLLWSGSHPIGCIYLQLMHFEMGKSLRFERPAPTDCALQLWMDCLKRRLHRKVSFDVLICGNLLATGMHGFHFVKELDTSHTLSLCVQALEWFSSTYLPLQARQPEVVLVKDFPTTRRDIRQAFLGAQYRDFRFQPNMVWQRRPHWHTFDDYLSDMSSKYRVRARRAAKKAASLQRQDLSLSDVRRYAPRLYALYKEIAEGADFNAFVLHPKYFLELKEALGNNLVCSAWFEGTNLIGFNTAVRNGKSELVAHFLGFDPRYNPSHQIYLNMLYDLVARAIDMRVDRLVLGRTALEIKSSVGAQAQEMSCFLRHRSALHNSVMPFWVNCLEPKVAWKARHPFKH